MQSATARTEALRGKRSIIAISPKQSRSLKGSEEVLPPRQDFSTATLPASRTNIEAAWSCSRKKNSSGGTSTTGQAEQELEDVLPDSAENGHALQEFDPRLLHGDTSGVVVIMICSGSVRKEERQIDRDRVVVHRM